MSSARLGVSSSAMPPLTMPEHRDAARIDDPLDAGFLRRQHQFAGALDIDPEHRRRIGHPQPVIGRDMKQVAAAGDRFRQRVRVVERALGDLDRQTLRDCAGRCAAAPAPAPSARSDQSPRHRRADKPGRPGNQTQTRWKRHDPPDIKPPDISELWHFGKTVPLRTFSLWRGSSQARHPASLTAARQILRLERGGVGDSAGVGFAASRAAERNRARCQTATVCISCC